MDFVQILTHKRHIILWSQQNVSIITSAFDWSVNLRSKGVVELQFIWPFQVVQICHTFLMVVGEWQKPACHLATCHLEIPTAEEGTVWCEASQPLACASWLLLFSLFSCMHLYAFLHVCWHACVCTYANGTYKYGGPRCQGSFFIVLPFFIEGGSLSQTQIAPIWLISLANFSGDFISLSSEARITGYPTIPIIYTYAGDLNCSLYACVPSFLITEPFS